MVVQTMDEGQRTLLSVRGYDLVDLEKLANYLEMEADDSGLEFNTPMGISNIAEKERERIEFERLNAVAKAMPPRQDTKDLVEDLTELLNQDGDDEYSEYRSRKYNSPYPNKNEWVSDYTGTYVKDISIPEDAPKKIKNAIRDKFKAAKKSRMNGLTLDDYDNLMKSIMVRK